MSFKGSVIKWAIKWTPKKLILGVSNFVLKDIAEVTDFVFDLETRKSYVQIQLVGESETIEVWMNDFGIVSNEKSYQLIIPQAHSNRIWLDNLLARITGKNWTIPVPAHLSAHFELIAELLKTEQSEHSEQSN